MFRIPIFVICSLLLLELFVFDYIRVLEAIYYYFGFDLGMVDQTGDRTKVSKDSKLSKFRKVSNFNGICKGK